MKISSLLVGVVLVGLFASVFGVFFSTIATNYGQSYDSEAFASYDKIQNITDQTQDIKEGLDEDSTGTGVVDLVGSFLKKGFSVLKITFQSFDLIDTMADDAITQIDEQAGGSGLTLFKDAIGAIIAILFLFIIIGVLVGRVL